MSEAMSEVEVELQLLGATAIEDKLQDGVADAISALRAAGMKVWMLTGDKVDTAVNIGFSCALWTESMKIVQVVAEHGEEYGGYMDLDEKGKPTPSSVKARLALVLEEARTHQKEGIEQCLVVDTGSFYTMLLPEHRPDCIPVFLQIAELCKSVICARVSPDQKGQVVRAVRDANPKLCTLAIGDGANDVPMIQRAHVGVGIYGEEGLQAVNSADYAIAQFRYLKRLLIVHGRWNVRRMGIVVCYMFYKNALLVLPQWLFAFVCLASGQNFYLEYPLYQFYNIVYTGLPIVLFGVMDQDLPADVAEALPRLYKEGPSRRFFNRNMFVQWQMEALVASIAVMLIPLLVLETAGVPSPNGHAHGLWYMGTAINFAVCAVSNLRLMIETKYWTKLTFFLFFLCFPFGWFFTLALFTNNEALSFSAASQGSFANFDFYQDATFWMSSFLGIFGAMVLPLAINTYVIEYFPFASQLVAESNLNGKLGDLGKPVPGSFIAPAPGKDAGAVSVSVPVSETKANGK